MDAQQTSALYPVLKADLNDPNCQNQLFQMKTRPPHPPAVWALCRGHARLPVQAEGSLLELRFHITGRSEKPKSTLV